MMFLFEAASLCFCGWHWLDAGKIKGLNYRRATLLSKESLACWLASAKGQAIAAPSQQHKEWMKEFQAEEQNSGMEPDSMPLLFSD